MTTETKHPNLSTEHQKKGDALRPSDTLDKDRKKDQTQSLQTPSEENE